MVSCMHRGRNSTSLVQGGCQKEEPYTLTNSNASLTDHSNACCNWCSQSLLGNDDELYISDHSSSRPTDLFSVESKICPMLPDNAFIPPTDINRDDVHRGLWFV